jgi:hypothetical protein
MSSSPLSFLVCTWWKYISIAIPLSFSHHHPQQRNKQILQTHSEHSTDEEEEESSTQLTLSFNPVSIRELNFDYVDLNQSLCFSFPFLITINCLPAMQFLYKRSQLSITHSPHSLIHWPTKLSIKLILLLAEQLLWSELLLQEIPTGQLLLLRNLSQVNR